LSRRNLERWPSLCLWAVAITVVWTLVLPWIGTHGSVRSRIDALSDQGIDPAVFYYTDLEAMERLESEVVVIREAHPDAFWSVSTIETNE